MGPRKKLGWKWAQRPTLGVTVLRRLVQCSKIGLINYWETFCSVEKKTVCNKFEFILRENKEKQEKQKKQKTKALRSFRKGRPNWKFGRGGSNKGGWGDLCSGRTGLCLRRKAQTQQKGMWGGGVEEGYPFRRRKFEGELKPLSPPLSPPLSTSTVLPLQKKPRKITILL